MDNFIKSIRSILKEKGLKQKAIAKKINMSERQFSDLLNGRKRIDCDDIPLLCSALGVTPNQLFNYNKSA